MPRTLAAIFKAIAALIVAAIFFIHLFDLEE